MMSLQRAAIAAALCAAAASARAAAAPEVAPRIITQQGLGLAMAFGVLETEIDIIDNLHQAKTCTTLTDGGAIQVLSETTISKTQTQAKIDFYFDKLCKRPFIAADVTETVNTSTDEAQITEMATYFSARGATVGSLSITDALIYTKKSETFNGLGTFTPVGGAAPASIGMACHTALPDPANTLDCQAGVAQDFPSLKLSLASVTPLVLTAANNGSVPPVSFKAASSKLETGALGALSITAPTPSTLGIGGTGRPYTSAAVSGAVSHFTLFPPTPTQWMLTDKTKDASFAIHVVGNVSRASSGTVTTSVGNATISVDQSGTGSVKYSDGRGAVVRSWLPAD